MAGSSPASNKHRCFLQNSAVSNPRKKRKCRNRTRTSADTKSDTVVRRNFLRTDLRHWPAGTQRRAPDKRRVCGRPDTKSDTVVRRTKPAQSFTTLYICPVPHADRQRFASGGDADDAALDSEGARTPPAAALSWQPPRRAAIGLGAETINRSAAAIGRGAAAGLRAIDRELGPKSAYRRGGSARR